MDPELLKKVNAELAKQTVTITLYTGSDNATLVANFISRHLFDTRFADTYCPQEQGGKKAGRGFNAYYGPGIYLTDDRLEAQSYGPMTVKFDCVNTPFLDTTGTGFAKWRKSMNIGGGPQAIMNEKGLAALIKVVNSPGRSYYTLRTGVGVTPSRV